MEYVETECAAGGRLKTHKCMPEEEEPCLKTFFNKIKEQTVEILRQSLVEHSAIKANIFMEVTFKKPSEADPEELEFCSRNLKTKNTTVLQSSDRGAIVDEMFKKLENEKSECEMKGSGWIFASVNWLELRINKYAPLKGKSHIMLPKSIRLKNAIVNVQNYDQFCFKYAIWTKHIEDKHKERVSTYTKDPRFESGYKWDCIEYPAEFQDVPKFEKVNNMSINIFGLDEQENVYPIKVCDRELEDHRDLLFLEDKNRTHYAFITNFERLISRQVSSHEKKVNICKRCFVTYDSRYNGVKKLEEHKMLCNQNKCVLVKMPDNGVIEFKKCSQSLRVPFVIYADIESVLKPICGPLPDPSSSYTMRYQIHEAAAYGYYIKDEMNEINVYKSHRAEKGVILHFLKSLEEDLEEIKKIYAIDLEMETMSTDMKIAHETSNICHICGEEGFNKNSDAKRKVADHDHRTSRYRGPAHSECNINYKTEKFIPVFFHNLSGYDSRFIVKELGFREGKITVIPESTEKYISFSKKIGKFELRFLDSCRFMPSSLSKLAENLPKDLYKLTKNHCNTDEEFELMTQKGVYPYEYISSFTKYDETCLPAIDKFYNKVNDEDITKEEYAHAKKIWDIMEIKNLGHYTDVYLKTDVLILADVFENFRDICLDTYKLDPAWFYSAPGLAWAAMLKCTKISLENITDYDMLLMIEKAKRGGLCQCIKRYSQANNKFMEAYDATKESSFISYLDANNLYGWAMCQPLPTGKFKWMTDEELKNFDVETFPNKSEYGYMLDVDIIYPRRLHDAHKELPYCAENGVIPETRYSKLITTLKNKSRYVAHHSLLKQAVDAGLKIEKIHRGLRFNQSEWLQPYIEMNTEKRKVAKNEFEKDFYKLMNNSVFGKTMENIRNRIKISFVTDHKKLEKLIAKPNFIDRVILKNDSETDYMVEMHMGITKLVFNKPIYVGVSILDISKTKMYEFHYDVMKPRYKEKIELLYMDTDSFFYETKTDDWYEDMKEFQHLLDTSDYPTNHPLHSSVNKKVIGKFKDEMNGTIIDEFVGLRAKMYAFKTKKKEVKKAKGVKRSVVDHQICFDHYKTSLFEISETVNRFNIIRSMKHTIYSIECNKKSLSPHDDKRIVLSDHIRTLPYGYNDDDDYEPPMKKRN